MKKTAFSLLIILVLLLVACQDEASTTTEVPEPTAAAEETRAEEVSTEPTEELEAPEPTAEPTAVATEEPAPEPTSEPSDADTVAEESDSEESAEESAEADDTSTVIPDEQLELMAAIAPPPQLSDREPGIHTVPCLPGVSLGADKVEGEDYYCGVFTVPQNWDEPDGRNLDLSFVVIKATGENPEPDSLVYLAGGPGQGASISPSTAKYEDLLPDHDVIVYDIRGAGLSQRLGYEECLVLALQNNAPVEQIEALQSVATNLLGMVSGEGGTPPIPFAELDLPLLNEICWEQFTAQGIDPNQFTTAANARDAVELIKALGYESFNIDSASYGTRLAMTIMDNIPGYDDAPELRSVVLDSTFPPSVYLVRTIVRSDHDYLPQLLDECQANTACNEAYPELSERLSALLNQLEESPLTANGETVTLDDVVVGLKDTGSGHAAYLPKMIAELEMGVLDTYLALRDGEVDAILPEPLPAAVEELDPDDPVQAFIAAALDLLSPTEALEFPVYFQFLVLEEDPLAVLPEFIAETYEGEIADQMLQISETLTAEDFANSPYVAEVQAKAAAAADPEIQLASMRKGIASGIPLFLYTSIHCADDILHESYEDAVNSYNDLKFPQLTDLVESQAMAGRCTNWPIAPEPIEVKDPVSSNIPALILQGGYDAATPVYMGQTAASELDNDMYVLVPQAGHVTWTDKGNCVGRITTAFVQDPQAVLDLSCLDARLPQWVLPGDGES